MADHSDSSGSPAPQVHSGNLRFHDAVVGRIFIVLAVTVSSCGTYALAFRSPTFFKQISDEYLLQATSCGANFIHVNALSGPVIPPIQPQLNGFLLATTLLTYLVGTLCFSMVAGLLTVRCLCNGKLGNIFSSGVALLIPGLYSVGFWYVGYKVPAKIGICVTVLAFLWLGMVYRLYYDTAGLTAEMSKSLPKYMTLTMIPVGCVLVWSAFSLLMAAMIFAGVMNGHVVPDHTAHVQPDGTCLNADGGKVVHCCMWQVQTWVWLYVALSCVIWLWVSSLVNDVRVYMIGFTVARWYFSHSSPPTDLEAARLEPEPAQLSAATLNPPLLDTAHDGEAASSDGVSSSDVCHAAHQAMTSSFGSLCVSAVLPNVLLRQGVNTWKAYFIALAIIACAVWLLHMSFTSPIVFMFIFWMPGWLDPSPGLFTLFHLANGETDFGSSLVAVMDLETIFVRNLASRRSRGGPPTVSRSMLLLHCLLLAGSWGLAVGLVAANIGYDVMGVGDNLLTGLIMGLLCALVGYYMLYYIVFLPWNVLNALHYYCMLDVKEQRCSQPNVHRLLNVLQAHTTGRQDEAM